MNEEIKFDKSFYPMVGSLTISCLDQQVGFLKEFSKFCKRLETNDIAFGGYIPINLTKYFDNVVCTSDKVLMHNANRNRVNIESFSKQGCEQTWKGIQYRFGRTSSNLDVIIVSDVELNISNYYVLKYRDRFVYISPEIYEDVYDHFRLYISGNEIKFDNLINILFMVKNGGEGFREVLEQNKPYMDRWTILDTGSTDNTISIIEDVLKGIPGKLYREEFINFRESRNRLLDLAGEDCCFNIMLDDSYVIKGDLRNFLTLARSDDNGDSFSLYIKDNDMMYSSNRVTKPECGLRYVYTIHEIIQSENNKNNFCIPEYVSVISDIVSDYMKDRTKKRKERDLELLFSELKENDKDERVYYYIAETFLCVEDWVNAYKYYKLRSEMKGGFSEEIQDSLYKMAVLLEYKIVRDYETGLGVENNGISELRNDSPSKFPTLVKNMLEKCIEYDRSRPDPFFMMGKCYLENNERYLAFLFLKKAWELRNNRFTMNNRTQICNFHIPNYLVYLCYQFEEYELGKMCAECIKHEGYQTIFHSLLNLQKRNREKLVTSPNLIFLVIDGGWSEWSGRTLYEKGLGGSETFVVKYAEYLAKYGWTVYVFCKTNKTEIYSSPNSSTISETLSSSIVPITYIPIVEYLDYLCIVKPRVCIINRYSEYIPVTVKCEINTYFVLHDLPREDEIIVNSSFLKGILCLTEWHAEYVREFLNRTGQNRGERVVDVVCYGLENTRELTQTRDDYTPYSFMYASFPNRGLLWLLKLFPKIVEKYPEAKLNIFCDLDHSFVQQHNAEEMKEIKRLLIEQKDFVTNHGWVNRKVLNEFWKKNEFWFYPCTFPETCCLTAMEAMGNGNIVITNHLAGLRDTVGDRGVIVDGNVRTEDWGELALGLLFRIIEDEEGKKEYRKKGLEWARMKDYSVVVPQFISKYVNSLE